MIKIRSLHLENYRGFTDTTIELGDHITCIAGINGAGKTSCLDALANNLSWITEMLKEPPYQNGRFMNPEEKKKDSIFPAKIETSVSVDNSETSITIGSDFVPGMKIQFADQPTLKELFSKITKSYPLSNRKNLPIFSYYPTNRSEVEIDISAETEKDLNNKYEIYKNNLDSAIHYKDFFRWFRNQEDRENAEKLEHYETGDSKNIYEDRELKAVRNAISILLPNFSKLKVDAQRLNVLVNKDNTTLNFASLADGEKGVITLFGDIARRLAIANETLENPLEGNGIILIDEIDLHMHPSWQRKICHALVKTFPNCQFVITTHSPQILGELKTDEIWLLNDFNVYRPDSSFGLTSNQILDEVMDVIDGDFSLSRDSTIAKKLQALNLAMETEKFAEAKKIIAEIEETTGTNLHEAESCKIALEMMESEE